MKRRWYELKGLSKPNSCTLEHNHHIFWATSVLTESKFQSFFDFCKDNWGDDEKKYCLVEFVNESDDGTPIEGLVIEFSTEKPKDL